MNEAIILHYNLSTIKLKPTRTAYTLVDFTGCDKFVKTVFNSWLKVLLLHINSRIKHFMN